jgi:hypothetical protein
MRVIVTALVSTVGTSGLATLAGATTSATGNAEAIRLYAKAVGTTNARSVLQDTSSDTYFLQDNITNLTNPSSFAYVLKAAVPKTPSGFVPAKTVTTYRLVHGVVKWATTLVLPECTKTSACKDSVGLEFYDTVSQEKVALLTGSPSNYCWAQSQSSSLANFAFSSNSGAWSIAGKFSPIQKISGQTLFVSRYSDNGVPITEEDYLSNTSHLFDKSVHHYAATGSILADTIVSLETDPTKIPTPPNLPGCTS